MHYRSYKIIISLPSFENPFLNIKLLLFIIVVIDYFNFYLKLFFSNFKNVPFIELLLLKFKLLVTTMFLLSALHLIFLGL